MNNQIKLALLAGKNKEKGFTTALALSCGLVATAVAITMVAKGQSTQISSLSQKATSEVAGIADAGIVKTQSVFLRVPGLARKSSSDWSTEITSLSIQCGANNQLIQVVNTIYNPMNPNNFMDVKDNDNNVKGKFRVKQYTVNGNKGTLVIQATTDTSVVNLNEFNNSKKAKNEIQVTINLSNTTSPATVKTVGLWVNKFNDGTNATIGGTNQMIDADVVSQDCSFTNADFNATKNFPSGTDWTVRAKPDIKFPELPNHKSGITVTNLATCSSVASYNNPDEANWFASVYQQLQNLVILPANAQTAVTLNLDLATGTSVNTDQYNINNLITSPTKGTIQKFGNGSNQYYTYTVNNPTSITANTTDTFTFTTNQKTFTVTVTIKAASTSNNSSGNNPSAMNDTATVNLPTLTTTIDPLANDTNATGATVTFTTSSMNNGSVTYNSTNKLFTYTLANNKKNTSTVLTDSFTYTLTKDGKTSTATVNITINPESTANNGGGNNGGGNSGSNYTLPGSCATAALNTQGTATTSDDTYDFLVDELSSDDIAIEPGKRVRIFVRGNIELRGNTNIDAQPNNLQIYGNKNGKYGTSSTGLTNTQEVRTRGGANIYAFIFAPNATAGVKGGGNGGGFYGALWVNNWAGPGFGSSSNKIVIDPPDEMDWTLLPLDLQATLTSLNSSIQPGFAEYKRNSL